MKLELPKIGDLFTETIMSDSYGWKVTEVDPKRKIVTAIRTNGSGRIERFKMGRKYWSNDDGVTRLSFGKSINFRVEEN